MMFRIAIGRCDCQPPYRDAVEEGVCKEIHNRLATWRGRLPGEVAAVPVEYYEEQQIEGHRVTFGTHRQEVNGAETLVVCQALLHTWSRPTFLSIGSVGRVYAEGLLVGRDGKIERAPDDLMWQFR